MVIVKKSGVRKLTINRRVIFRPYNFVLYSKDHRRVLGYARTYPEILRREKQVQAFKHMR
jgi:hypothetical protein